MYQKPPGERHSAAGRSLLEMLWEELDTIMDRLMADGKPDVPEKPDFSYPEQMLAWGEERGRAQGVTYAIAVITNPYDVDVPAIKKKAAERWEERNSG